ncbi:MAG: acetylornithine carbamoyltransferase [Bacteroidota bacterium]
MHNYLSIKDVTNLNQLVQVAQQCKAQPFAHQALGKNKTLVLLFMNPSLRTRLSTQKAAQNLGMNCIVMNLQQGWQLEFEDGVRMDTTKAEHIREAAAVISQYADIIGLRSFPTLTDRDQDYADFFIQQLTRYASVPVVSLESAIRHPLQSLADALTIAEYQKKERPKVVLTWAPHLKALPQAVGNSFVEFMQQRDVNLMVTHPKGYELAPEFIKSTPVEYDQAKAFENADFIYAKNWSSYESYGKILPIDQDWMITMKLMQQTNNAKFMHCLPVRRNVVVEDAVLNSDHSVVIEQANNRTFAAQAVLKRILETKR